MKPKYELDIDKLKTLEDVILILGVLQIRFEERVEGLEKIKHLIKPIEDGTP